MQDPTSNWSPAARGVAILPSPGKGMGVFATTKMSKGTVISVYRGESLTNRQYLIRYEGKASENAEDQLFVDERLTRISNGAVLGPAGAYSFDLLPAIDTVTREAIEILYGEDEDDSFDKQHVSYLDAEDPDLSSRARHFNHQDVPNAETKVNTSDVLVWITASRDIGIGEEICFNY